MITLNSVGYLKRDADRFLPFIDGLYFDMDTFCKSEVEPMNKECEQIQIIALTEYLGIGIEISYLDGKYVRLNAFIDPFNSFTLCVPITLELSMKQRVFRRSPFQILLPYRLLQV